MQALVEVLHAVQPSAQSKQFPLTLRVLSGHEATQFPLLATPDTHDVHLSAESAQLLHLSLHLIQLLLEEVKKPLGQIFGHFPLIKGIGHVALHFPLNKN